MHQESSKIIFVSLTMFENYENMCISSEIQLFEVGGSTGQRWIYKATQNMHSLMFFPGKVSKCWYCKYMTDFRKMPYMETALDVQAKDHFILRSCFLQLGVFQISLTSA